MSAGGALAPPKILKFFFYVRYFDFFIIDFLELFYVRYFDFFYYRY